MLGVRCRHIQVAWASLWPAAGLLAVLGCIRSLMRVGELYGAISMYYYRIRLMYLWALEVLKEVDSLLEVAPSCFGSFESNVSAGLRPLQVKRTESPASVPRVPL